MRKIILDHYLTLLKLSIAMTTNIIFIRKNRIYVHGAIRRGKLPTREMRFAVSTVDSTAIARFVIRARSQENYIDRS